MPASVLRFVRELLARDDSTAADKGHLEVVKALLEAGAGVDVLDHDNWSPRQVSTRRIQSPLRWRDSKHLVGDLSNRLR